MKIKKLSRNFVKFETDGTSARLDLREPETLAALRNVFLFNPLAMPDGSMIERDPSGKLIVSDNLGLPKVGRPKVEKPLTNAERQKRFRDAKKLREMSNDE